MTIDRLVERPWLERALLEHLLPGYAEEPVAALLLAADRVGLGPVPLFDAGWYRARYAVPAEQAAFAHYLAVGAAKGHDPHPLFSAAYYVRNAPEAAGDALRHFLEVGGPAGLDCHQLFASRWYWETNPDVRAAGMVPLVHYLQWGAAEGRWPNPLFSVPHYLAQADDPAAKRNPLRHFVLEGERAGLTPHPSFRPKRVLNMFKAARRHGALATYLAVIGVEQPARAAALDSPQPELPLVAPPLAVVPREPGTATASGSELLRAVGLAAAPGSQYGYAKLEAIGGDPAVAAEFAAGVARGGGAQIDALIAAAALVPARQPRPPGGDPDASLIARYATRQFAAAARFRLDPAHAGTAPGGPTISILLPVYRTPIHLLERTVLSVLCQTYPDWELCVVDDGSLQPGIIAALSRFAAAEPRIKVQGTDRNLGIAAASNRALAMASGAYVGLLDHDDMLAADALAEVARALEGRPDADLVYTDECRIDLDDLPVQLFPKPDWSPALLTSFMYTGHFSVYRAELVRELGGFRSAYDLSQDYDLALRVAERDPVVVHLREILYGWRTAPGSGAAGDKPHARATNIAALESAMGRRGWAGAAVALPTANRVVRSLELRPLVSIIVPSDDETFILQTVMSVVAHTSYDRFEIVVVARDGVIAGCKAPLRGGRVRFVPFNAAFNFSAKCNAGAEAAAGEVVLFLNDDVRVLTPEWLEAIVEALAFPGVGAVAPKLLYADNTIQHAGMITGTRRLVGTAFHCFPHATHALFNMAQSLREVSLLSGACLAMPTVLFRQLGGFDTVETPVAHSDVDLCLRVEAAGYRCLYTPHAALTHLGHQAIGAAEQERPFRQDKADIFLMRRWGGRLEQDPFFPPPMRELLAWGDHQPFRYYAGARRHGAPPRGDALLVSHDLSASGAPKVLWDVARVLLRAGRYVLVISREDGPFRDRMLELGADVIIDPGVLEADPACLALARNFDLVIANTVLCWRLLPELARFTPTYLYSHEKGLTEEIGAAEPGFVPALSGAAGVWTGSERAAGVLRRLGLHPVVLEYGLDPPPAHPVELRGRDIVIAMFASLEPRKGQDLAVKAFLLLPPALRDRCRLRLHGRAHDVPFTQALRHLAAGCERIQIGPELDAEGCERALASADIVLCPSRDDVLPVTSLEALAAGKILVVSKDVGTSAYLEDGVSGFVLRVNDPQDIAATLARIIVQRAHWGEIAEAAGRLFREHFSTARFTERLLGLVGDLAALDAAAD